MKRFASDVFEAAKVVLAGLFMAPLSLGLAIYLIATRTSRNLGR